MRPIDADALKEAMNYNGGCGICFRYIDNADTIDAIPVEWLKAMADKPAATCGNPYQYVLDAWQDRGEAGH